jgi:hypothetical protein
MFFQMALAHTPEHAFSRDPQQDFATWKQTLRPKVMATLGDWPQRVPLNPELVVEWDDDGLTFQRWFIDVGPFISAALITARPQGLREGERRPAILCWHGHGKYGKDSVMGFATTPERSQEIAQHNYDYGRQMAKAGFVTYAIDWMAIGERNDNNKPHYLAHNYGRDWCNLYYLNATMLGMTSISINVTHGMAATDLVCTLPFVDADRLGVMGLSGGGTMTTWTALCDERISAADIICYHDLWAYFGFRDYNYCGMQVAPGLFKIADLPDVQGLFAPKPLLVEIGVHDTCFTVDTTMQAYRRLEQIYQAAGAAEQLQLDLFPTEHAWGGNKSVAFFTQHLGAPVGV